MECPFQLCSAWVTPVVEQARPDDDELTIQRIPIHNIEGSPVTIACPASLLPVPLNPEARQLLDEQVAGIERIVAERFPPPEQFQVPASQPPQTPQEQPMGENWFRWNPGSGPNNGPAAQGYPVVRPLPGQGVQPNEIVQPVDLFGGRKNTMSESHAEQGNAMLAHARQKIGEIQTSISEMTNQLETVAAQAGTFQQRGEEVVGAIMAAAEGSQTHDWRIQEAAQTVHYATNDETSELIATIQNGLATLNSIYGRLAQAVETLEQVVF